VSKVVSPSLNPLSRGPSAFFLVLTYFPCIRKSTPNADFHQVFWGSFNFGLNPLLENQILNRLAGGLDSKTLSVWPDTKKNHPKFMQTGNDGRDQRSHKNKKVPFRPLLPSPWYKGSLSFWKWSKSNPERRSSSSVVLRRITNLTAPSRTPQQERRVLKSSLIWSPV